MEFNKEITETLSRHYSEIIDKIGEDISRDGLMKTPERAAKAIQFLTKGYHEDPEKILQSALFEETYNEMVLVKDIEVYSLCEHHILPFFGKAHVAYIPNGKVVGLSKIPRIVDVYARRLQVQERLTQDVLQAIEKALRPQGVAVIIEARHMCMMMRGVEKQNSATTTSAFTGQFRDAKTRAEFLNLVGSKLS